MKKLCSFSPVMLIIERFFNFSVSSRSQMECLQLIAMKNKTKTEFYSVINTMCAIFISLLFIYVSLAFVSNRKFASG